MADVSHSSSGPSKVSRWSLRSGLDRRFRGGHPWVFSNELTQAPHGQAGGPVELVDNHGGFLARGYGNPHSLIAFRAISRDPAVADPWSLEFLKARLNQALRLRLDLGFGDASFRLCFGEADRLPGLVIDRYRVKERGQVFVVQAHTAGADVWLSVLEKALASVAESIPTGPSWADTAILVRNDLAVRQLEGVAVEEPRVLKEWQSGAIGSQLIEVVSASAKAGNARTTVSLEVAIEGGQKTAFYLDQSANVRLLVGLLERSARPPARALDLCSYVGQWGAQISNALRGAVDFTLVDASQPALDFARKNLARAGAKKIETLKADVIGGLDALAPSSFDLVIADPPALVKSRKHLPAGKHAYLQLNSDVFRLVRDDGWVVSCSCSALLDEEEFLSTLSKAARRSGAEVSWIARGTQAPDHPVLAEFPEGRYLKCWIGRVRKHGAKAQSTA